MGPRWEPGDTVGAGRSTGTPATGTPATGTPATGAPGRAGGAVGARGPAGSAIYFERQLTAKRLLKIEWDYPASLELTQDDGPTRSSARMYALSREEAFARLTKNDRRPLLILRECERCKGTEDAFLSRTLNNERTQLLAQWFHCVKFKANVLEPTHTFRHVFAAERPAHMMLCTAGGSNAVVFDGTQSQSDLWDALGTLLRSEYKKDPEKAVKEISRFLDRYDHLDAMELQVREQLDLAIEEGGPETAKAKRLQGRLDELKRERAELDQRRAKLFDLGVKTAGD